MTAADTAAGDYHTMSTAFLQGVSVENRRKLHFGNAKKMVNLYCATCKKKKIFLGQNHDDGVLPGKWESREKTEETDTSQNLKDFEREKVTQFCRKPRIPSLFLATFRKNPDFVSILVNFTKEKSEVFPTRLTPKNRDARLGAVIQCLVSHWDLSLPKNTRSRTDLPSVSAEGVLYFAGRSGPGGRKLPGSALRRKTAGDNFSFTIRGKHGKIIGQLY